MEAQSRDPKVLVPLPSQVEDLLAKICEEQSHLQPLDAAVRRRLAALGEADSVDILQKINSSKNVKNLAGFIIFLIDHRRPQQSSPPTKARRVSLADSPNRSPGSSPPITRTIPYFDKPRETVISRCSLGPSSSEIGRAEKEALGELEFRKQFLILNYIGGNELHSVTTVEEIRWLKDLPIAQFEVRAWERFGRRFVDAKERRIYQDWDSKMTYVYDCHVSTEGSFRFKGPFLNKSRTHLQKVLGDDYVLRVKFAEDNLSINSLHHFFPGYRKIAIEEGILVGLRRYYFFVYKDGGKEDKKKNPNSSQVKCYFVCLHSDAVIDRNVSYILFNKTIREARSLFMHIHTLTNAANYMARFSLILSKTYSLDVDLTTVNMCIENDIYCLDEQDKPIYRDGKPLIHSDGTGDISEDLAMLCPKNIHEGTCKNDNEIISNHGEHVEGVAEAEQFGARMHGPPMLIQCRLFNAGYAIKGTFLVNKTLGPKTIKVRNSMIKVHPDKNLRNHFAESKKQHSLEIVGTSNKPKRANLSRNLIALLSYGGVPDKFFKDLLEESLQETNGAFRNIRAAVKVAMNHSKSEYDSVTELIMAGIPLDEPYLQYRLTCLLKDQKESLKDGKIYIPESYYLMGTVDPTGKLESNEVCIVLDNGQLSGEVLVYRNPGLHFGDIRVLKATYVKELESVVGNAKYAIFFSRKGPRSVADEIAGGDFDGDMYWISRHPMLLHHFKPSEPWIPNPPVCKVQDESRNMNQFSDEEFENELFKRFLTLRFQPSFAMGESAGSCQAMMDRFLTLGSDCTEEKNRLKDNIIKLNDIYCCALDAPKKGLKVEVPKELKAKSFPHYMEKKKGYISTSILGYIYDRVKAYQDEEVPSKEIWKLPYFKVDVPPDCLRKWSSYYKKYREEMCNAMNIEDKDPKNEVAAEIKRKYKELLYGAEDLEERSRSIKDIYNEALAIYHVCYDHAMAENRVKLCNFAWSVAGSALCRYQISKHRGEKLIVCSQSTLCEMLLLDKIKQLS